MVALNKIEEQVMAMVMRGEVLHGTAREIWVEMQMREMDKLMRENKDVLIRLKNA